jgi:dTDP-4-amino-4,6-dideoxygalactose transaminase
VATVSHTAVATVAAIELAGAEAVLLDIDPTHYTLDPHSLVRALESVPRIAAVIPVHLYGQPADMPAINEIAHRHGLRIIEDCAQAHGTRLQQRYVGLDADAATFSFYPTKNLGALGDAGLLAVASAQTAERVRRLREYGWKPRYVSIERGMNSRLDEVQAAVLRYRLPRLEEGNRRRAQIAAQYDRGLAGLPLVLPRRLAGATHSFHQYVVRHTQREALQRRLREAGVQTLVHYPVPVHLQPAYAQRVALDPAGLPVTEQLARECLSLPMYPELSDEQVAVVIDAVQRCA